jgi:hypothetical protein
MLYILVLENVFFDILSIEYKMTFLWCLLAISHRDGDYNMILTGMAMAMAMVWGGDDDDDGDGDDDDADDNDQ